MRNCTLCIVSPEYEHIYSVCLASLKKFLPSFEHIKISTESTLYKEISRDYPYSDIAHQICAVRPAIVRHQLQKHDNVLFLGSDIVFYDKPYQLLQFINTPYASDVFVTPHVIIPCSTPVKGEIPNLAGIAKTGHINSDFVCWKHTKESLGFLNWQAEIHKTECVIKDGVFLDQTWLNFLPFFKNLKVDICKDVGYNAAYWRNLQKDFHYEMQFREFWVNTNDRLVFFQFSGFIEGSPEKISKYCNYPEATGDYLEFLQEYDDNLKWAKNGI